MDGFSPTDPRQVNCSFRRIGRKSFWTADHEYSIVRSQLLAYTT
jgi:hypothetical protein